MFQCCSSGGGQRKKKKHPSKVSPSTKGVQLTEGKKKKPKNTTYKYTHTQQQQQLWAEQNVSGSPSSPKQQ